MISTVRIGPAILDLSRPAVMSVLNVTPDSFYAPSRVEGDSILRAATDAVSKGASILDIGGCSTRPGSVPPDTEEEYSRVRAAFSVIRESIPGIPLSIDTYRAEIVRRIAVEFGPVLVNDISGGSDPDMFPLVSGMHLPYVLCHFRGNTGQPRKDFRYGDLMAEMLAYFSERISQLTSSGVYDIILDPGFGFSKDAECDIRLLRDIRMLTSLGFPIMAGVSRKSFICRTAGCPAEDSLPATSAVHMALLEKGVSLLRVHDTAAAMSTIRIFGSIR